MEEGNKKLGYVAILLGAVLLIILLVWLAFGQKKIISPVPEEGIKVIFVSPNLVEPTVPLATNSSPTPKATVKATPKVTATPKPTVSPTPKTSASPNPSPTATP